MSQLDFTHDPARRSWLETANSPETDFPIQNLPFGVFSTQADPTRRGGIAVGDQIVDLKALAATGRLKGQAMAACEAAAGPSLNPLLTLGIVAARALRHAVSTLLGPEATSEEQRATRRLLVPLAATTMHRPMHIGGFTDFFTSAYHAERAGRISRPHQPLPPAFRHLPMGYNGRASSVRVTDELTRPWGVVQAGSDQEYRFSPTEALDYELEVGAVIASGSGGAVVALDAAPDLLFGLVLVNDWSSRDVQRAESFPLGPFLAKNSLTAISPWIVTADALAPYRTTANEQAVEVPIPAHLRTDRHQREGAIAMALTASIVTPKMRDAGAGEALLTRTDLRNLYWTFDQMIAHHASGGCALEPGDLLGSGTVSGKTRAEAACLYEICIADDAPRFDPITLPNGEQRRWVEDGDDIVLRGWSGGDDRPRIGFGECRTRVVPAQANVMAPDNQGA